MYARKACSLEEDIDRKRKNELLVEARLIETHQLPLLSPSENTLLHILERSWNLSELLLKDARRSVAGKVTGISPTHCLKLRVIYESKNEQPVSKNK